LKIGPYSVEEFSERVRSFHGNAAPGVMLGGFMVDAVLRKLPNGRLYDALCETARCLQDAIQLLTPCTVGNGWLKVINLGRFALALYDKSNGQGIRIFVDADKVSGWREIYDWYFKVKKKAEQDGERLFEEIKNAGAGICGFETVHVKSRIFKKESRGGMATCPECGEGYPSKDGSLCLACQGESPYTHRQRSA
jgi:formylmethanofuran dehydrogenase subunit E